MHTRVDTQLVVASAHVLHQRVTTNDHTRGPVMFQTSHRTEPCFQSAVIIFDPIVRALPRVVKRAGEQLVDHNTERSGPVSHDP